MITQSWTDVYGHPVRFQLVSALDLPHEFRGRSDRECQDLRLGRLGVPRPARIAARLTLCPRDLPGLRIRLTTVPCILPERLELTWCHRGICRRDRLIIVPWFRQFAARVACVTPETCQGIDGYDRGTNRWYFQRILSFFYLIMIFSYFIPAFLNFQAIIHLYSLFSYARLEYSTFIQNWFRCCIQPWFQCFWIKFIEFDYDLYGMLWV